ncbi:MFS general substrate transporter [Suhomyces tanzawaensis NRRL Y-17324]|uniref:MFS general substrate transporter n=1 Tax=Suhomyces tanzawaensis NRRL Y-17324 TaxID=984487 RepID=A0A1E4SHH3_9ASCO|nr:MFS general substrate transporter [Suhomyces tanzawaensis NRRL Y-17324]ODV78969.1 MFS general substrate transporter [Suhomyces tanzawaensis NRRL Y-17324]
MRWSGVLHKNETGRPTALFMEQKMQQHDTLRVQNPDQTPLEFDQTANVDGGDTHRENLPEAQKSQSLPQENQSHLDIEKVGGRGVDETYASETIKKSSSTCSDINSPETNVEVLRSSRTSLFEKSKEDTPMENNDGDNLMALLDDPSRFPEGGTRAYLVLLGSCIGLTGVLSFTNSVGVFEGHISQMLPDTPLLTIGWIFSVNNFLLFGMTLILGPIFDHIGCKIPILVGTTLMTVGYMCMSVSTTTYQFILSYGILGGFGVAFTFGPFVAVLTHYFLKKRAMAIGLAYIGGALGGVIFPIMFRSLIPKIGFGWSVRIGSFISLSFLLTGWALVSDRHTEFQKDNPNSQLPVLTQILKSIDFKVFKNKTYSCLVLGLLGNGLAFLLAITYLPSYAIAFGFSPHKAYMLLVVFNACSIPGRVIPSLLADRYGRFNLVCCISLLSTLAFFVVWVNRPVAHTLTGLYVFAAWFGFSSGSILSLSPAAIGQIFKVEDIGAGIGTAFFIMSFGDLIGIPIGGAITNSRTGASFDHLVLFLALACLCGTTGSFVARWLYGGPKWVIV